MKKILSLIIAISMVAEVFVGLIGNFSVSAEIESDIVQSEMNNGKEFIEVDSIEDLYLINYDLTANYILTADINMTEATAEGGDWDFYGNGWNPIGSNNVYGDGAFSGEFDGNGHKIIGMRIDIKTFPAGFASQGYCGLFAKITGYVHDLFFVGGSIFSTNEEVVYAGALAGYAENATISNISIKMDSIQSMCCGGVVGACDVSTITDCNNNTKIYANANYSYAGGIVGQGSEAVVTNCYNTGECVADSASIELGYKEAFAGGICGYLHANNSIISNCYNTGSVLAKNGDANWASGIAVCRGTIQQCYNMGNVSKGTDTISAGYGIGLYATITNSYYLSNTGLSSSGATSLTKAQMLMQILYLGFDFENVWVLDSYASYPYPQLRNNIQDSKTIKEVRIVDMPEKTNYYIGDKLELSGLLFKAIYFSGETESITLTEDMISGFNNTEIGTQIITVTYKGKTATFQVTVNDIYDNNEPTPAPVGDILGATVDIGSSLTINYFAEISEMEDEAKMRFTSSSGRVTEVNGIYDSKTGYYKFAYTGINPQCMGDTIKAELMWGDYVLDTKESYSIKSYCENQISRSADDLGLTEIQYNALKTLLADMLVYGSEAQKYKDYNVSELPDVDEWISEYKSTFTAPNGVKKATGNADAENKVKSAGLNMANVNRIYFKLILNDENVVIKLNNEVIDRAELIKNADGTFTLYSSGIKATGFNDVYTLTLTQGEEVISTVEYNVNAYIQAKNSDATVGNIVKALSNYGASAKRYHNFIADDDFDLEDDIL